MPGTPVILHPGISGLPLSGSDYNDNLFLVEQSFLDQGPFVISGLVPSATAGLVVNVSAGVAVIGAQLSLASFNIAPIPPNVTADLYHRQNGSGVALAQPSTPPAASVLLGTA